MNTGGEKTAIGFTRAEALVLFEWLKSNDERLPFAHPAEQTVLWRLEAALERILPEAFAPDYEAVIAEARAEVTHSAEVSER
jgi:hypothetical protein